jgi:hypothetical protein
MVLRRNTIPENIRKAAKRAGLSMPHGYVGRNNGHDAHKRKNTVASIIQDVKQARTKQGKEP